MMTWYGFWTAGERYFDRFYTVSTTLMILKVCGYLSLGWTPVFVTMLVAFVAGMTCGFAALACERPPEKIECHQ